MTRRHSFATIVVGQNSLLREGVGRILRSANFRIVASVSCADDLLTNKLQTPQPLFLIVHTGNDFDFVLEQIGVFRESIPGRRQRLFRRRHDMRRVHQVHRTDDDGRNSPTSRISVIRS